jgi:hypothetical protein
MIDLIDIIILVLVILLAAMLLYGGYCLGRAHR